MHQLRRSTDVPVLPVRAGHSLAASHESSVGPRSPSMEVPSSENPLSIAVHSTNGDGQQTLSVDAAVVINIALARAGLSLKEAAAHMDLDASLWSRQLQGKGANIDFRKLLLLPIPFWRELIALLAEPAQLAVTHEDMAEIALKQVGVAIESLTRGISTLMTARRIA